ncbi:MAG: DUF4363 family protein [Bacillota bacterium]
MKALISVILVAAIIIIGWMYVYNTVDHYAAAFKDSLAQVADHVNEGNWTHAVSAFSQVDEEWKDIRKKWTILLDHHEIDNIDLSMARANQYIKAKNTPLSLGEIEVLKQLFDIVRESEALTFNNVL